MRQPVYRDGKVVGTFDPCECHLFTNDPDFHRHIGKPWLTISDCLEPYGRRQKHEGLYHTPSGHWIIFQADGRYHATDGSSSHKQITPEEAIAWFNDNGATIPKALVEAVGGKDFSEPESIQNERHVKQQPLRRDIRYADNPLAEPNDTKSAEHIEKIVEAVKAGRQNMGLGTYAAIIQMAALPHRPAEADAIQGEADGKQKPRGRKADPEQVRRDTEIAADWERAKAAGTYKADFARDKGIKSKELDKLLRRVAMRTKRANK